METPDKEMVGAPGEEEVEFCCVCGATEDLVVVDRESAIEPDVEASMLSNLVPETKVVVSVGEALFYSIRALHYF